MLQVAVVVSLHLLLHTVSADVSNKVECFKRRFKNEVCNRNVGYVFDFRPLSRDQTAKAFGDCVESGLLENDVTPTIEPLLVQEAISETAPYLSADKWNSAYGYAVGRILEERGLLKNSIAKNYVTRLRREIYKNNAEDDPRNRICAVVHTYIGFVQQGGFDREDAGVVIVEELYKLAGIPVPWDLGN